MEKKQNSLWIQTASDKFYPDFVIRLKNGVTLAVEYKGQEATDDAREKDQLGKLWAERSEGKCRFVMVGGENWHLIERAAAGGV